MTLLIPTHHELGILTADKPLRAILRPMEVQPERHDTPTGVMWRHPVMSGLFADHVFTACLDKILKKPFATGDVIAWQEEWWEGSSGAVIDWCDSRIKRQLASTMHKAIARFRNTVAECRPVKVAKLDWQAISRLGLESIDNEWHSNFRERFCIRWPDIPLDSWAWWIALDPKGKSDG